MLFDLSVRQALVQYLEGLQQAGIEQLAKPPAVASALPKGESPPLASQPEPVAPGRPPARTSGGPEPAAARITPPAAESRAADSPRANPDMPRRNAPSPTLLGAAPSKMREPFPSAPLDTIAERMAALDVIRLEAAACTRCRELACTRTQTVFGVGAVRPRVMFFGEAPGADEDRTGEPFVGRAGQLLTDIIKACTWRREEVYIFNVLKCRPPDNRTPNDDEIANCRPFFERQIEIIRPEYIVCVGNVPSQALLETKESIGKMRGRFHNYRGIKVLCTYHPSYLLRNPSAKKHVWDDMKLLLAEMGVALPQR